MEQNVPVAIPSVELSQPPKSSKFLVILLSVLLFFSISASIFFALQTQKLAKQLTQLQVQVQPTPTPLPSEEITISKNSSPSPVSSPLVQSYTVPPNWSRVTLLVLSLCLPPKWEADQWGNIYFNRDSAYRPNVTYIQEIPYKEGSRREAYYKFWESEYPNVRKLVSIKDVDINGNSILLIDPVNSSESKTSPEGSAVIWYTSGKLWKAGIGNWSMINNSKTLFLKDFYTMIGCSF